MIFDPIGITAPITVPLKILLKELLKSKLACDIVINEIQLKRWSTYLKGLKSANNVIIELIECFAVMKEC